MDNYIGLGDSVSISAYPSLSAGLGARAQIGAIDLTGQELMKLGLVKRYKNLAWDGAEIHDVYRQISPVSRVERAEANVISLTIGGNDISFAAMRSRREDAAPEYRRFMAQISESHDRLVLDLLTSFPNSVLLINNSYDVTDGLGALPDCGAWTTIVDEYSIGRRELGNHIRDRYSDKNMWPRVIFHDIFKHFDGRGLASGTVYKNGWYYKDFLIEPGHVGAQEISGLWVQSVIKFSTESQKEDHLAFSR